MVENLNPIISVVIPVYNRKKELDRALNSLAYQNFKNFEVIICDDGSTDDLYALIESYSDRLTINYIRIENSGGPARPRNIAASAAKSNLIAFLDSDDWWYENRLSEVLKCLKPSIDIIYHPLIMQDDNGRVIYRGFNKYIGGPISTNALKQFALFGNPIPLSSVVMRKSLLIKIGFMDEDKRLVSYEDFDTWLKCAEHDAYFYYLDKVLGVYSVGQESISKSIKLQIACQKYLFRKHQSFYVDFIGMATSRNMYVIGLMYGRIGDLRKSLIYLTNANKLPSLYMEANKLLNVLIIRLKLYFGVLK